MTIPISFMALFLGALVAMADPLKSTSKDQIQCTMCSSCENPCGSVQSPPPPSPPPASTGACPPPPSPPSSGAGTYYYSPPPPSSQYTYYSPPPPASSSGGGIGGTGSKGRRGNGGNNCTDSQIWKIDMGMRVRKEHVRASMAEGGRSS
ncbi:leucine-rich repeat extensin-like protein 6 [Senna tora]|uniref:Leucine-rich repeat extensin-like protein 6 n=1 Tax=Senna tora TaxID=362788 RepID=A0A834T212_9FABA|nr:leucine-rich repeat extensin-like protein 6 [Senna tora]